MRVSKFYVSTLKEAPAEADIASQQLMLRAGLIRKLGSGLYTWMPLGLLTLRKVEAIIREEMNRAGALELVMPVIQPAELWQETGRWEKMGPNMLRPQGPARARLHRGTDARGGDHRHRAPRDQELPATAGQLLPGPDQVPRRDPAALRRHARAREFIMKDAYSFDVDEAGMLRSYQAMYDAYVRIFTRLGLKFRRGRGRHRARSAATASP